MGLILSRQNLPVVDRNSCGSAEGLTNGAYVICDSDGTPDAILIATGSEVSLAISAARTLKESGINVRVVSAPCLEWFRETSNEYRERVLPKSVKARVAIEAGVSQGWREIVGDEGEIISLEHFGASGSASTLFKEYGLTVENVITKVKTVIHND